MAILGLIVVSFLMGFAMGALFQHKTGWVK